MSIPFMKGPDELVPVRPRRPSRSSRRTRHQLHRHLWRPLCHGPRGRKAGTPLQPRPRLRWRGDVPRLWRPGRPVVGTKNPSTTPSACLRKRRAAPAFSGAEERKRRRISETIDVARAPNCANKSRRRLSAPGCGRRICLRNAGAGLDFLSLAHMYEIVAYAVGANGLFGIAAPNSDNASVLVKHGTEKQFISKVETRVNVRNVGRSSDVIDHQRKRVASKGLPQR
jgi:hypothetical protein